MMNVSEISINRCVALYLMSSYLYYKKDTNVLSDGDFDAICKRLLAEWKNITHPHKKFLKKGSLKAGTGFNIKKYPTIVMSAAERWKAGEFE